MVQHHTLTTQLFRADATDATAIAAALPDVKIDIVLTDIPYGRLAGWGSSSLALVHGEDPIPQLLESLLPILSDTFGASRCGCQKRQDRACLL